MNEVLVILLEVVVEILGQLLFELLADFGFSSLKTNGDRENRSLWVVAPGLFVLGAAAGGLSLLFWPTALWKPGPIPGLSLILGPLGTGATMHAWGKSRRAGGYVTTNLATFAGGAAFAFGSALVRFLGAR